MKLGNKVIISGMGGMLEDATGEFAGVAAVLPVVDMYIIILDKPMPEHKAVVVPSSYVKQIH